MNFTFIDLFAGIGGFHLAMSHLGGKCLLASEIDENCISVYKKNYQIDSGIDIKNLNETNVPIHDLLCAGFPCQAFSKAGKQEGLNDTRGTLFFEIERIIKLRHPKYIILENVRSLTSHDNGNTWRIIKNNLKLIGYRLTENPLILSPHQFGIPQLRERVYILGVFDPQRSHIPLEIHFEKLKKKNDNSIYSIIEEKDNKILDLRISSYEKIVLKAWDEFYKGLDKKTIGFPIWSQHFNENKIDETLPEWKKDFIRKNQSLFLDNKTFIKKWLKKYNNLKDFSPTHRKFEWQAGTSITTIWEGLIQFRPSGIRVKKPDVAPTLVAMVQIPIIGKYKRRLSVRECARLQSFPNDFKPDKNPLLAYKQLGNSVNVKILEEVGKKLFKIS
jgi:DNA (cytosine-5)-methyltransferase 1